ncbi:MAG: hypothetical protein E7199_00185 [Schwartzia succinivorans]|nr:hypothetical protein [Schwartzia succinivorans]
MIVPVVSETAATLPGGVFSEPWFWDAALATAVIETPIFWLCGYRRSVENAWFFVVNIVSNLLLNEFISATPRNFPYPCTVLLGEIFVVLLEFALCGYAVREKGGKRLFRVLLLTNAVSFLAGVIYFLL